ncbi:NosD domain-containing protein [Halorussus aquaticus]|uniref:NosD domain-containing protein n=1 Tax=Halorussus aquaticus TaxID=2953748 RepID=A0ABD5Q1U2_9EURY|nr:NosD domain-containing protein [Halorussus aquaticus]
MVSKSRRRKSVLLIGIVLVSVVSASTPASALPQSSGLDAPSVTVPEVPEGLSFSLTATTIVVDSDGSGDYRTIQAAVDNASAGDTVRIEPGVYAESVRISKPLDVRAPNGATLDGSSLSSSADGIRLYNDAKVSLSGVTVTGYDNAIFANGVDRNVSISDVTLRQNRRGLYVDETYNRWEIHDSVVENNSHAAVQTSGSSLGNATANYWGRADGPTRGQCRGDVDCGYFLSSPSDSVSVPADRTGTYVVANDGSKPYATIQDAVRAAPSRATVEVRPGTYTESVRLDKPLSLVAPDGATLNGSTRNSGADAIRLYNDANVTLSGFTVEHWDEGVRADNVDSEFLIENVVLRENQDGLYVEETYNRWDVQHSEIYNNSHTGIYSADHLGDATENYWGQSDGPTRGQCRGDVDCGYFLSSPTDSVSVPSNRTGTYVVANDGSKPYATIQDAVRAAPSRATVEVRPGTYTESVRLDKPLSFVAPDGATLDGANRSSGADGVRLYNDANVTLSGFTIEQWDDGIRADNVNTRFLVENVVLRQNRDGLYVEDTYNRWDLQYSEIYNNSHTGVRGVSSQVGDATENYWGQSDGPLRAQCRGDVDCGYFLSSPDGSVDVPLVRPHVLVVANDGSAPYATIQDAVRAAKAGDTVEVRPGVYRERVRIQKDINLTAPRGAHLNGSTLSDGADGIYLSNGGGASISGFVVREFDVGVRASSTDRAVAIGNSHLVNNSEALRVRYANAPVEIHDSMVANNRNSGIYVYRSQTVDATRNYWGQIGGPVSGQCDSAADCSSPLSGVPEVRGDEISYTSPSELEFNVGMRTPVANRSLRLRSAGVTTTGVEIAKAEWHFGDGATARGLQVAHAYDSPGVYTVTHSVVTDDGRGYSVTRQIKVGEEPEEFDVVSVTPHLSGHPRKDVVVIEGLPLDLSYRAAVSQPSNTAEVRFRLNNSTYVDSDGSDGYTFPVNTSNVTSDETLVATAVHTNGTTASRALRVGHVSTPGWFEAMTVSVTRPTHGYLILSSSKPASLSNKIPNKFPFKDEVKMPGAGENQKTSAAVTVTIKVDLTTTETEASVSGGASYDLEVVNVTGNATGKAFVDLEEGNLTKGELELKATATAEYPPPPTGVPSPPIGPVPPGAVSLYPIFSAELKVTTTFDETDTAGSGDNVSFEFEKGEVSPKLGAKQELGKKWNEFALVLGLEEEIVTKAPLPGLSPIDGTVAGQLYARAQAYMFTQEAYYPSGKKEKFTYDFELLQEEAALTAEGTASDGGSADATETGSSGETSWNVRERTGDRPPKPTVGTGDGSRQTLTHRMGFVGSSFNSAGGTPTRIAETGVVTNNTVADESPAVTRIGDAHTVAWSHQSAEKSALNGRDIRVSRMDDSGITSPSPVTDDSWSDYDPALAGSAGNGSLAAFTTFDRTFENVSGPSDVYAYGEIRIATSDGSGWDAPQFVTDDADFDFAPAVAQRGDEWVVAWTEDADENLTTWRDQSPVCSRGTTARWGRSRPSRRRARPTCPRPPTGSASATCR